MKKNEIYILFHQKEYTNNILMVFSGYCGFLQPYNCSHDIAEIVLKVTLSTITLTLETCRYMYYACKPMKRLKIIFC